MATTRDSILEQARQLHFDDAQAARSLLQPLCEADDAEAWCIAGDTYDFATGILHERHAMSDCYLRAYNLGSGRAAFQLGLIADNAGRGTEAYAYFREAFARLEADAARGCAIAYHHLGLMYCCGFGVEPDDARYLEMLERAAELGNGASSYTLYLLYRAAGSSKGRQHYRALKYAGIPHDELYEDDDPIAAPPN